ncbi:FAD-binding oxidoreductase [Verticiella sediminum]|uniref:FAD-binding oxidoreductase n=1 Tax=Verticiella sediminum TaxID=1247510 RepID=A0A556AGV2_9BURK|nr:FAD-binding oxidoreductase [Verticiella sediminum]TSH92120.1 FAD-binding oxidoreductase [Verticiella sediminum]
MTVHANPAASLPAQLPGLEWIVDPLKVGRLSSDFSWFSPVLKEQLAGKRGDVVVRPRTEDEIRSVVGACARQGIPITVRGSGTGNYGQSTPLQGGLVLDLSAYNAFGWARRGVGRAQAGIRLADFDKHARPLGYELRWLPSTFRTATLGGLFGGGFGGAGSITYGPVAATGNVLGARVMTVEPEPRVLELHDAQAMLLHHTYGTTGIVLELEVALAPAQHWMEGVAVFTDFEKALHFANDVSANPALIKKDVCFLGAPIPQYLTPIAEALPAGCHAVLLVIAECSEAGMRQVLAQHGGELTYCKNAEEVQASGRTLIEFTWNHTTLNALKHDKSLTYIQSAFDPSPNDYLGQIVALEKELAGEVMMHLEFLRTKEGGLNCSGIQLVRYTTPERLNEIMQIHRDHGVRINNPHVYVVEDGKQGKVNPEVVALKQRLDPQGLLNPGKLRGWDELRAADGVAA